MHKNTTLYDDVNEVLELLLTEMQRIFGTKLVALYLYGSLVTGDFDRECSDIDLVAVTSSDIDEKEAESLHQMHDDIAERYKQWDGRIEVAYISTTALQTFRTQRSPLGIISPGEPFHVKDAGIDWLMNWYTVLEKGIALYGPSPKTLIAPISREEYVQAVREHATMWREWIQDQDIPTRGSQAYAILTMCRALYTLKHDEQVSKKRAAEWAQKELPAWASLIQNALLWREASWHEEHVDHSATYQETLRFVQFAINQCENIS